MSDIQIKSIRMTSCCWNKIYYFRFSEILIPESVKYYSDSWEVYIRISFLDCINVNNFKIKHNNTRTFFKTTIS